MDAKMLRDKYAKDLFLPLPLEQLEEIRLKIRALDLLAAVEGPQDEIVRELREFASVRRVEWSSTNHGADMADKAAAALVAERAAKEKAEAERDSLKQQAEAMVAHLNDGIQVDVDPEDGTQSPRSEWDFVANELVAAYRAAHPKEGA